MSPVVTPEVERYFALIDERQKLETLQSGAVESIRPAISLAIEAAMAQIEESRASTVVGDYLYQSATEAQQALEQIESLQSSVDLGLLPQEALDAQREEVLADPRVVHAVEYISELGILDTAAKIERLPEDEVQATPAETVDAVKEVVEVEPIFPEIKITILGDGVQIGQRGKFVKLSKSYARDYKDYSNERLQVLKVLVGEAGNGEIKVADLWEMAFPGTEVDKRVMGMVKGWLDTLTYRRSPIVIHNGNTGSSSAYHIENPNVTIREMRDTESTKRTTVVEDLVPEEQTVEPVAKPQTAEEEVIAASDTVISETGTTELTAASVDAIETPKTVERVKKPVAFPLSHVEAAVIAEFLVFQQDLLSELDMPVPEESVGEKLHNTLKRPSLIIEEVSQYEGGIVELRKVALMKVIEYFNPENAETVLKDIDNMEALDNRYELFEYFIEFDQEQRQFLLDTLVEAIPVVEVVSGRQTYSEGRQIMAVDSYMMGPDGQRIGPAPTASADDTKELNSSSISKGVHDETVVGEPEAAAIEDAATTTPESLEDTTPGMITEIPAAEELKPLEAPKRIEAKKEPEWLRKIREEAKEVIQRFVDDEIIGSSRLVSRRMVRLKSSSGIDATETMMERAVQNGIITANQMNAAEFSVDVFVCMALQNANQNVFDTKQRRKRVMTLVTELVDEYYKD